MSVPHVRGIFQQVREASAAKGAGTLPQAFALYMSLARDRLLPGRPWLQWRAKPKHHATHRVLGQTGNPAQFWNFGDESAIGWASNVAETVHVSVLPRALMQKFLVWLDKYIGLVVGE